MPETRSHEANGLSGALAAAKRHPIMTATVVVGLLGGAVLGALYLDPEWSLLRRVAAGTLAGGGAGFFIVATKLIG
ncbi:MAG: hypothetical protein VCC02_13340 [Myxococcota bacterium]